MAEARTGNNGGSGRSMAWLDVWGNLCLLLSPASSAELPMQQGSWKWSLACHQVRWGCGVWGCHFPYLLPDECAEQADFVRLSPCNGEADTLGLGLSRRAPRTCPLACSIWWDVRGAAAWGGCVLAPCGCRRARAGLCSGWARRPHPGCTLCAEATAGWGLIRPGAIYLDLNNNKKRVVKAVSVLTVNHSHIITTAQQQ